MNNLGLDISVRKGLAFAFFKDPGVCTLHGVYRGPLAEFFDRYDCSRMDLVVWEEPYSGMNPHTYKQLVKVSAQLEGIVTAREIPFKTIHPMHWKPAMGKGTKGEAQRKLLTAIANSLSTDRKRTLRLEDDDEVDAICLGFYGRRYGRTL